MFKLNAEHEILWQKMYGGTNNEELDFSGRKFQLFLSWFNRKFGGQVHVMFILFALTKRKRTLAKTYGGINQEGGNQIISTDDGNYLLFGFTQTYGAGDRDFYTAENKSARRYHLDKNLRKSQLRRKSGNSKSKSGGYLLFGRSELTLTTICML